jgi:hypothetical protein
VTWVSLFSPARVLVRRGEGHLDEVLHGGEEAPLRVRVQRELEFAAVVLGLAELEDVLQAAV